MNGILFIVSAPSGAGKTSLVKALLERVPSLVHSISCTTRAPRAGEKDGVDYHFVTVPQFVAMRDQGIFLESAEVHGNHYGTPCHWMEEHLAQGLDVLLEIDWQGAQQVSERIPRAVKIFILPPSLAELRQRLEKRGKDSPAVIQTRLAAAGEEVAHAGNYDYWVLNQELSVAVAELTAIVQAARLVRERQEVRYQKLVAELIAMGQQSAME